MLIDIHYAILALDVFIRYDLLPFPDNDIRNRDIVVSIGYLYQLHKLNGVYDAD
jgi:hypothetical protein